MGSSGGNETPDSRTPVGRCCTFRPLLSALRWGGAAMVLVGLFWATDSRLDTSYRGACLILVGAPLYMFCRSPLPRHARWTAVLLTIVMWYPLSMPYLEYACRRHFTTALPALRMFREPLQQYQRHQWPGWQLLRRYENRCGDVLYALSKPATPAPTPNRRPASPGAR